MPTQPQMHAVRSTNVEAVGHDGADLHVKFKGGAHYVYHDVPDATFRALMASDSIGLFVHTHIKGKFPHRKV